jgi:FAD/FMN-containing dehydrogenase
MNWPRTSRNIFIASVLLASGGLSSEALTQCLDAASVPQILPSSSDFTRETQAFNLRLSFTPAALIVPTTESHIQSALACALQQGVKVAARSGGHSYGAHGLGGADGYLVIDMRDMSSVVLDPETNIATIGPGARLGKVATELYKQGNRGISHGTCPG